MSNLISMGNENNNKLHNFTIKMSSQEINENINNNIYSNNKLKEFEKENNDFKRKQPTRFATVFQWDGDGKNVYLTGSFCDWHQFFEMEKCEDPHNEKNNKFFLTLFLPKGTYQYKFKIDEQWKCNSNFPTCSDKNGNINNIIDLTKQKKEEGTTDFTTSYVTSRGIEQKLDETKFLNISQILKNENNDKDNDNEYDKELSDICSEIKIISENSSIYNYNYNYNINFDLILNQKQSEENKQILEEEELNWLIENCSYKKIKPLRHEHIDHLFLNKTNFNKQKKNNCFISSCSFRYGFKTTTIIYYTTKIKKGRKN